MRWKCFFNIVTVLLVWQITSPARPRTCLAKAKDFGSRPRPRTQNLSSRTAQGQGPRPRTTTLLTALSVYFVLSLFSGLTNIDLLRSFLHLRYVDLSKNELDDVSALGWLDHLLTVRVDFNLLSGSIVILERRYLQVASFANNRLTSCDGAAHPMLDHLCLNSMYHLN